MTGGRRERTGAMIVPAGPDTPGGALEVSGCDVVAEMWADTMKLKLSLTEPARNLNR
jgi:hypothetical protein